MRGREKEKREGKEGRKIKGMDPKEFHLYNRFKDETTKIFPSILEYHFQVENDKDLWGEGHF